MIAHKEKKYFHPQKHIAHSIKISRGFLILMQCINKLYLYPFCRQQQLVFSTAYCGSLSTLDNQLQTAITLTISTMQWSQGILSNTVYTFSHKK